MKSQDISFCLSLIGKPWVSGASGPEAFDCWGLLRHVYQARRGVTLCPYADVEAAGLLAVAKTAQAEAATNWRELASPEHFACVGMSRGRRVEHVGLWLEEAGGGILHCFEGGGVVFQSQLSIRKTGIQNFIFYQFRP